ncbi:chemotaxis protein CheW [Clostridium ihumii]|uniref:chemotaxis protein CheW n=1 Tax=Clostridium ihumii TaxID=1470356 RepID=UPI00058C7A83|nr:chemotaxis protein CheW [Clostridium ihumii]
MSNEIKMLVFMIGDQFYSGDIMEVERILNYEELAELPDSPQFLKGIMNYEGNILPVISLSEKFNRFTNEKSNDSKIIVTRDGDRKIGIIVDSVSEVKSVKEEVIEESPEMVADISKRYIKGFIKEKDRIIIFLSLSTILSEDEKELVY